MNATYRIEREADGTMHLLAPAVGLVRGLPETGALVSGGRLGAIEVLGVVSPLVVPPGIEGRVVTRLPSTSSRSPVAYGQRVLTIVPARADAADGPREAAGVAVAELVFRAPMSGRFYARPAPDKPALVEVGAEVATGTPLCLLEVMKTFNRIPYGGSGLPDRARIVRVCAADGDDVTRGAPLFELAAT